MASVVPACRTPNEPAIFCTAERVLNLYNQVHEKPAMKTSKRVREWMYDEAHQEGWSGVHFVPEVQSRHGAGCMLWVEQNRVNVQIDKEVLVFVNGTDE